MSPNGLDRPLKGRAAGAFIFSVSYVGDLVTATLTFDALGRELGPLTLVTSPIAAPLVEDDPCVESVRTVRSSRPLAWRWAVLREVWAARRQHASLVNLEVFPPRWAFVRVLGRALRLRTVTLDLPELRQAAAAAVTIEPRLHVSSFYARCLPDSGAGYRPRLPVTPERSAAMRARLRALPGWREQPLIVVHPGSSSGSSTKRAPPALFEAVLDRVARVRAVNMILIGTASERPLCESIAAAVASVAIVTNWAGCTAVGELPALIGTADLFIGNDSGPLRIAEAVGARTLSFWGPTPAAFFGPRGPGHRMFKFEEGSDPAADAALQFLTDSAAHTSAVVSPSTSGLH